MAYVEIEITEDMRGGFVYDGYWESSKRYRDEYSARKAAEAWLDGAYGAKKWQHI